MDDAGRLDGLLSGLRPPSDDVQARLWIAEAEARLFGAPTVGVRIGRYRLLHRLGGGGGGVVFVAHDPELDRKVAIKLVRPAAAAAADDSDARARLVREARALAKLAHPNVVAVYDAGTWASQVYVAMELVSGQTLAAWLRAGTRSWRAVVEVFLQAGWGLAAAHDAGLVHRDFKPSNVVIGADGRARVLDFGLAKAASRGGAPPAADRQAPGASDTVTDPVAAVGTLAYMAPEQHDRAQVTPRADQYAFCIALWEGLFGERPFDGATPAALRRQKVSGRPVRPPPRTRRRVPRRVLEAVLRGLAPDPAARWPDMHALLRALRRATARPGRRWASVAALVGVTALGLPGRPPGATQAGACEVEGDAALSSIWDEGRRARLRSLVETRAAPARAAEVWSRIETAVDRYAADWRARRSEACRARDGAGARGWAAASITACLDERLYDLAEVLRVVEQADLAGVDDALYAVASLPPLRVCDGRRVVQAVAEEAGAPAADREGEARLARARALERAGAYEDGLAVARGAVARAQARDDARLEASARLVEGKLLEATGAWSDAESSLHEALQAAERTGADDVAARALVELVYVVGRDVGRFPEAHRWASLASGKIHRLGSPEHLEGEYWNVLGAVLEAQGRYRDAEAAHRRAMDLRLAQTGPDHILVASSLNNLGNVAFKEGHWVEAQSFYEHALSIYEAALGPMHPRVAPVRVNVANVLAAQGRNDRAQAAYEHALRALLAAFGPDHPQVIATRNNLATLLRKVGRFDRAREELEAALAGARAAYGEDHPMRWGLSTNLGEVARLQGDLAEALAYQKTAVAGLERLYGPHHPDLALALINLARVHLARAEPALARRLLRRAERIVRASLPPEHPWLAEIDALMPQGRGGRARKPTP